MPGKILRGRTQHRFRRNERGRLICGEVLQLVVQDVLIAPGLVFDTLRSLVPPDAVVVEEAPSHRDEFHERFPSMRPGGFLTTGNGVLGWGLPLAVGAFGGVLVNLAFRQSFLSTGSGDRAYLAFIAFYAVCFVLTWVAYLRPGSRLLGV